MVFQVFANPIRLVYSGLSYSDNFCFVLRVCANMIFLVWFLGFALTRYFYYGSSGLS
jgi:hypothetical protein